MKIKTNPGAEEREGLGRRFEEHQGLDRGALDRHRKESLGRDGRPAAS